ncbi:MULTISPECIES: hypothetical protein [unclassified Mycolicibacterium]|uniref:hypothetical protein n=1 Tax=unclassified Mycolicibacterium TaxID=2636767 RepID=UPI001EE453E9|nr:MULTISPECIES: hypothetical protein [unclassified Mycolicibacterium]MUM06045.1 hypothetical protein [Mycolicibacterium sp. CBMA 213]
MKDRLSKNEIRKDVVQESVEAVAGTVGEVTNIIVSAVKDVASSIGALATDAFEIRDGARRARAQLERDRDAEADDSDESDDSVDEAGPVPVTAVKLETPAADAPKTDAPETDAPKTDAE